MKRFQSVLVKVHLPQPLYNLPWQLITANHGSHVVPHVLRATHGAKPFTVRNAPDGKINFNGTDEDWVKCEKP